MNRVLGYAPMVAQDGHATVYLTTEDWHVVADTLFHMDTPDYILPESINSFRRKGDNQIIELKTPDGIIDVEMM